MTCGISKVAEAMVRAALFEAASVMLTRAGRFSTLVLHRLWVGGSDFRSGKEAVAA